MDFKPLTAMRSTQRLHANGLIVFSDLDGTLLDHQTYSYDAARPALQRLRERGHALVLASSKTAAEIAPLRAELGFSHCPAIVENGAGILPPENAASDAADLEKGDHQRVCAALTALPDALRQRFQGFSEWSPAQIAERTGLGLDAAKLAAKREFSEPGVFVGSDEEKVAFVSALKQLGVTARHGGRFLTLSLGETKASRMKEIINSTIDEKPPFTFALGDAQNDIEMLETADKACIIANPHGATLPKLAGEKDGRITRSTLPGPEGWRASVLAMIEEIEDASNTTLTGA